MTLATPYGRLPATALQRLGWQWRCLAYLAPLYGLDDQLVVVHPTSWAEGCWPLVRVRVRVRVGVRVRV